MSAYTTTLASLSTLNSDFNSRQSDFNSNFDRAQNIVSTGQKIGIGLGVAAAVLIIAFTIGVICFAMRRRKRRRAQYEEFNKASMAVGSAGDGGYGGGYNGGGYNGGVGNGMGMGNNNYNLTKAELDQSAGVYIGYGGNGSGNPSAHYGQGQVGQYGQSPLSQNPYGNNAGAVEIEQTGQVRRELGGDGMRSELGGNEKIGDYSKGRSEMP